MKQSILLVLVMLVGFHQLNAQVYPYQEDFESYSGFGNISLPNTWAPFQLNWVIRDGHGKNDGQALTQTPFMSGSKTTVDVLMPLIGAITANSVMTFRYNVRQNLGGTFPLGDAYTLSAGQNVKLYVSTDGGTTFSNAVYTLDNSNQVIGTDFTEINVDFSSFSGENVTIKWELNRPTTNGDLEFFVNIDDINVSNALSNDVRLSSLEIPQTGCGLTDSEVVKVKVFNNGVSAQADIPFAVDVAFNGGTPVTVTGTVPGTLNGGEESAEIDVNIDLSTPGDYTIVARTTLSNDENTSNDEFDNIRQVTNIATKDMSTGPLVMGFEPGAEEDAFNSDWTIQKGDVNDNDQWAISAIDVRTGQQGIALRNNSGGTSNGWFFTPCLEMKTGVTYQAVFYYRVVNILGTQDISLHLGTDKKMSAMTTVLVDKQNVTNYEYEEVLVNFTVDIDGIYHLGWHVDAPAVDITEAIRVDDIVVKELKANDVTVVSFNGPEIDTYNCYSANQEVKVTVRNIGGADLTNVPVEVAVSGAATTTLSTTVDLLASESKEVLVGTFDMSAGGVYFFDAKTALTTDEVISNDDFETVERFAGAIPSPILEVDFAEWNGKSGRFTELFPHWTEVRLDPDYPAFGDEEGSYWGNTGRFGQTSALINLFTGLGGNPIFHKKDMIKSPVMVLGSGAELTFKTAVTTYFGTDATSMGSDDEFQVVVITDCGATQTVVAAYGPAHGNAPGNTLTEQTVSLSAYAGQEVAIGFIATTGTVADAQDYDFHLDDIAITSVPLTLELGANVEACDSHTINGIIDDAQSYVWTKDGDATQIGDEKYLVVEESGTYTLTVTKDGQTASDDITVTILTSPEAEFTFTAASKQAVFTNISTNADSYSWNFGDGTGTSTDADPSYTYADWGQYTVELIASSALCGNDTFSMLLDDIGITALEIDQTLSKQLEVFPNPSAGAFTINLSNTALINTPAKIQVYDLMGKLLHTEKAQSGLNNKKLELKELSAGVYLIKVNIDGRAAVAKVYLTN